MGTRRTSRKSHETLRKGGLSTTHIWLGTEEIQDGRFGESRDQEMVITLLDQLVYPGDLLAYPVQALIQQLHGEQQVGWIQHDNLCNIYLRVGIRDC